MNKKFLRALLITCILISFGLFLQATDAQESFRLIRQLGNRIILIFLCTFLSYLFGALGWKYCIDSDTQPSLPRLFMLRHIGNVITVFNPSGAVAGEIYNAKKLIQGGIDQDIAYKSVLLSRIIMILAQLVLLLIVLVWFLFSLSDKLPATVSYVISGCFVIFSIVVSSVVWLLLKKRGPATPAHIERKRHRMIHRLQEMRTSLTEYIRRCPKNATIAFTFFTTHWILASLELFFILYFLGFDVSIWDGLFLDTVIIISKSAVSFIPGQFGAEELINKFALYLIIVNSAYLWLSVSIIRRSRQLFWSGMAFLFYIGLK